MRMRLSAGGAVVLLLLPTQLPMAMEQVASPEAVRLLKKLAAGHPGSRLTREAKESLARLERLSGR